jgi:hypothetical protein
MLDGNVTVWNIKHENYPKEQRRMMFMRRDDICFYRFTGGDMN